MSFITSRRPIFFRDSARSGGMGIELVEGSDIIFDIEYQNAWKSNLLVSSLRRYTGTRPIMSQSNSYFPTKKLNHRLQYHSLAQPYAAKH